MPALPEANRTLVMGILNVTPDSFSDGGRFLDVEQAISHGVELARSGADVVDVGGESTRPGAHRVDPSVEVERVVPVIRALTERGIAVSVDTMRAGTARAAVEAGACLVNDVSGGLADPGMADMVASLNTDFVAMHWRAHSPQMDSRDAYDDVVADVRGELATRIGALVAAGIDTERIIVDPGLGFSKVGDNNWRLLAHLDALQALGHRVLVGASRKRFLGAAIARVEAEANDPGIRDNATTAVTALVAQQGTWGVRVHNARAASDAIRVVSAWQNATYPTE